MFAIAAFSAVQHAVWLLSQLLAVIAVYLVAAYSAAVGDFATSAASARCVMLTRLARVPTRVAARAAVLATAAMVAAHTFLFA